uniref:ANK_REP_REGION domain-containing protein n=1 Tax=Globodera pallida TaxID=36090 RepID=A0A183CDY5_GLOPA
MGSLVSSQWLKACLEGNLDIVEHFVENGQDVNFAESGGATGLIVASGDGKANVVRFLLSKGARVDHQTIDAGNSALFCAVVKGHLEVCKLLVAKGADVNQGTNVGLSPWLLACAKGHLDIVEHFVEHCGQDVNFASSGGVTGLMCASGEGKPNVVRFLLSKGARVDRTMDDGNTALDLAVSNGHGEIVELLTRHASASAN